MKIPNPELQKRVFGYAVSESPPENSLKGKTFEFLNQGLSENQIEELSQVWKRMQDVTQSQIVNPITKKLALKNKPKMPND